MNWWLAYLLFDLTNSHSGRFSAGPYHPFHSCGHSIYPFLVSLNLFFLATSFLLYLKHGVLFFSFFGLISLFFVLFLWGNDICIEGLSGCHSFFTQNSLNLAFSLFLFSEFMFFVSIFWVFFDAALSPPIELGGFWPPMGIVVSNYTGVPLFGTCILLSSAVTVTWSHSQLLSNYKASSTLFLTILLSLVFVFLQYWEYSSLSFSISDSIYGSIFYFSTGFHGFHVLLGATFLLYNLIRLNINHFSPVHHVGIELAILYWHFVDVVWIFLYVFVYWWGS